MDERKTVVNPESDSPVVVALTEYRGVARLDVRQHFYTREGELQPTKKGISLTIPDGLAEATLQAMRAANAEPMVLDEASGTPVVVQLRAFKGRLYLDARRHYVSGGELQPTRKGVSLAVDVGLHERVLLAMAEMLTGA